MSGPRERWSVQASGFFVPVPEWLEESEVSDKGLRLWVRLYRFAQKHQDDGREITRAEIAQLMGWSQSTTDRELKGLESVNALSVSRFYDATTKRYVNSTFTVLHARPEAPSPVVNSDDWTESDEEGRSPWSEPVVNSDERPEPVVRADDASSTREGEPSGPSRSASTSPRPSRSPRAVNGQNDPGLTPGATPTPQPPAPARSAEPMELARRLFAMADQPLARNVRTLAPILADLLGNGFSAEAIEAAALAKECRAWTYNGLAFQAKERQEKRRDRPAPPLVVAPPPETEEERAARLAAAAPERERALAQMRERKAARLAAQRAERGDLPSPTLQAPAEEVAG